MSAQSVQLILVSFNYSHFQQDFITFTYTVEGQLKKILLKLPILYTYDYGILVASNNNYGRNICCVIRKRFKLHYHWVSLSQLFHYLKSEQNISQVTLT